MSKNAGVRAAFEKETGLPVTVDPNGHLMGAFGVAILARRSGQEAPFDADVADMEFVTRASNCGQCANNCERILVYRGRQADRRLGQPLRARRHQGEINRPGKAAGRAGEAPRPHSTKQRGPLPNGSGPLCDWGNRKRKDHFFWTYFRQSSMTATRMMMPEKTNCRLVSMPRVVRE